MTNRLGSLAVFIGFAIAMLFGTRFLAGGADTVWLFGRGWWPGTTLPAWLFFSPIARLSWPDSWTLLVFLNLVGFLAVILLFPASPACCIAGRRWWQVCLSPAFLFKLWLGQVEGFVALGVILGWKITHA